MPCRECFSKLKTRSGLCLATTFGASTAKIYENSSTNHFLSKLRFWIMLEAQSWRCTWRTMSRHVSSCMLSTTWSFWGKHGVRILKVAGLSRTRLLEVPRNRMLDIGMTVLMTSLAFGTGQKCVNFVSATWFIVYDVWAISSCITIQIIWEMPSYPNQKGCCVHHALFDSSAWVDCKIGAYEWCSKTCKQESL